MLDKLVLLFYLVKASYLPAKGSRSDSCRVLFWENSPFISLDNIQSRLGVRRGTFGHSNILLVYEISDIQIFAVFSY